MSELNDPIVREVILGNYGLVYHLQDPSPDLLTIYHGARLFDPSKLEGKDKRPINFLLVLSYVCCQI